MSELYEICREKKENTAPRITNQDLAEAIGKSTTTVAQFLRGDAPNASYDTVLALCRELGVSVDEYNGLPHEVPDPNPALLERIHSLESERKALADALERMNEHLVTCKKSLKMHRFVTTVLLAMFCLVLLAIIIDLLDPNVGWIRRVSHIGMQWLNL